MTCAPSGRPICGWSLLIDLAAHSDTASRIQPHEQTTSQPGRAVTRSPDPPADIRRGESHLDLPSRGRELEDVRKQIAAGGLCESQRPTGPNSRSHLQPRGLAVFLEPFSSHMQSSFGRGTPIIRGKSVRVVRHTRLAGRALSRHLAPARADALKPPAPGLDGGAFNGLTCLVF